MKKFLGNSNTCAPIGGGRFASVEADILLISELRRQEKQKQLECIHRYTDRGLCTDCGIDLTVPMHELAEFRRECREGR